MYWSALMIGLLGGLHCSLMCSPLLTALFRNGKLNLSFLIYQGGRITTYILLGAAFYFLGSGFEMLGIQQVFSLLLAAYVIYFYLIPPSWRKWAVLTKIESKPYQVLKQAFNTHIRETTKKARYFQGLLNGLLPCGLVYLAVANSLLADTYFQSAISMVLFGIATIPWLAGSLLLIKAPIFTASKYIKKLKPALILLLACFLILRGFGVNYLHIPMPQTLNSESEIVIPICGGK
ncbi:MAG: sulfite exporter TauE/SafE [Marivirga sp.]|jgi:sulfite exporter TauE/SafE